MVTLFEYSQRWFLRKLFLLVFFLLNGKNEVTKRVTNKILKITDQFLYFRFEVKYLKDLFPAKCVSISPLSNSSLKTSLVSNPVIPISTNCFQLPTIFTSFDNRLEVRSVFLDMSKAYFHIETKSISGELLYILSDLLSNRKQRSMVKICHGPMFMLEFHKDLF